VIPYGKQNISTEDISSVIEVLKSDFLTQGPCVPIFEKVIKEKCHSEYAIATNSATSALHIACLSLGLTQGDWLWTSPTSFVASANCGLYCGANIDFVDIDLDTFNMSISELEKKLQTAESVNKLPKIVIPVHFGGESCDMSRIRQLSIKYGFSVIEDASHAIGGRYQDQPIGSCKFSDITVFSFHPVKIITSGEGGMAVTNSEKLAKSMQSLRSHGITRDNVIAHSTGDDLYYEMKTLGFNYRMTDIQAALGSSQARRLDKFIEHRQLLTKRYQKTLKSLPIDFQQLSANSLSAAHLFSIKLHLDDVGKDRVQIVNELKEKGVGTNVHYIPIHTHPFYRSRGFGDGDFPNAEYYYSCALTIPLFHGMTTSQQDTVIESLSEVLL
jgi:UDP-4-amino-4,6-dideoxy-N-acetyl-beta-L-altrosamine transaminase